MSGKRTRRAEKAARQRAKWVAKREAKRIAAVQISYEREDGLARSRRESNERDRLTGEEDWEIPVEPHSLECDQAVRDGQAWLRRWPDHCKECLGLGGLVDESAPAGISMNSAHSDLCRCLSTDHCPRCGADYDWFDKTPWPLLVCSFCRWNPLNPDGHPAMYVDCFACYEMGRVGSDDHIRDIMLRTASVAGVQRQPTKST